MSAPSLPPPPPVHCCKYSEMFVPVVAVVVVVKPNRKLLENMIVSACYYWYWVVACAIVPDTCVWKITSICNVLVHINVPVAYMFSNKRRIRNRRQRDITCWKTYKFSTNIHIRTSHTPETTYEHATKAKSQRNTTHIKLYYANYYYFPQPKLKHHFATFSQNNYTYMRDFRERVNAKGNKRRVKTNRLNRSLNFRCFALHTKTQKVKQIISYERALCALSSFVRCARKCLDRQHTHTV